MDGFVNEDGYRLGQYRDNEKLLADVVEEFNNMPPEVHHRHEDEAYKFMRENGYLAVAGDANASALVIDDPQQRAELAKAIEAATPEELKNAKTRDPGSSPPEDTSPATGAAPMPPQKPSSIQAALAGIQLSPKRQDRFLISGDPLVERSFYDRLARDGKLLYSGGQPVIMASYDDSIKYLNKASQEIHGKDALQVVKMNFDRQGRGILGSIKADVLNALGRFDRTTVFVVGDQATTDAKLKEIGALLSDMEKKGVINSENIRSGDKSGLQFKDGLLVVPKDGPVVTASGKDIYDMVSLAKNVSQAHGLHEQERMQERREFKAAQEDEKVRESKDKSSGGSSAAAGGVVATDAETTKLVPPHPRTEAIAQTLDGLFASSSALHSKNERGQAEAVGVLYQARGLKDPQKPELATLPTEQRQKFVAQLSAVAALVDAKEFGRVDLDAQKDGVSVRDKLNSLVELEIARDPSIVGKTKELLKEYEVAGLLTDKQVASALSTVDKFPPSATKPEPQATSTESAATAYPPPPVGADFGKDARALLDEVTVPGQAPNNNTVAEALYAVGDQGHFTVAALDPRSGDAPTKTLEKLEGLVQEAIAGKYGEESQRVAEATQSLVARWKHDDAARVSLESSGKSISAEPEKASERPPQTASSAALPEAERSSAKGSGLQPAQVPEQVKDALASTPPTEPALSPQKDANASPSVVADVAAKDASTATLEARASNVEVRAPAAAPEQQSLPFKEAAAVSDGVAAKEVPVAVADTTLSRPEVRTQEAPPEQQASPLQDATYTAALGAAGTAPAALSAEPPVALAAAEPVAVEKPAVDPDYQVKLQRLAETESAAGLLAKLMANPAGSFTNRDESWNVGKLREAAEQVLRLDSDSVATMSPKQRGAVQEYGSWLAINAYSEKVPGFDSIDGKAQATAVVDKMRDILGKFDSPAEISSDVEKSLAKADRLVTEKDRMSNEAESSAGSSDLPSSTPTKRQAAESFAKDLAHMVYQKSELTEADVRYAMKGAGQLTPQTMKQLTPELKAQAVVALEFLSKKLRDGALGDFSSLPPALKKNIIGAQQVVNTLNAEFSRDSSLTTEMIKAAEALPTMGDASKASSSDASATAKSIDKAQDLEGGATKPSKSAGRDLER